MNQREVVVLSGVRTAIGTYGGTLKDQPPVELGAAVVREAVPDGFLLVGSGVNESNAARLLASADGAIVGTSLKRDEIVSNLIDPERVKRLAEIIHELGS